jgi:hypothetical protein
MKLANQLEFEMLIQFEAFTVYRDATQYYGLLQSEVDEMDRYNSKHYDALYIE